MHVAEASWQGIEEEGGVRPIASASDVAIEELGLSREGMDIEKRVDKDRV